MSKTPARRLQQKHTEKDNLFSWWIFLCGLLVVPLLIGFMIFPFYSPQLLGSINDTGLKAEIFTSLKWYALLIVTGCSLFWFISRLFSRTITIPKGYFPILMGVLFVTALLSLILAEYKGIALYGNYDMRDGTLSWLCFLLLGFIAGCCRFPVKCKRPLFIILTCVLFGNCVMGLLLFFGINLAEHSDFMKLLMFGRDYNFNTNGRIYGTLSNPNYLSALASALASFFMVYFLKTPSRKTSFGFLIPIIFAFSIILTSISSSGLATLAACSAVLLVCGFVTALSKKQFLIKFALLSVIFGGMFSLYASYNPLLLSQAGQDIRQAAQAAGNFFKAEIVSAETDYPYPITSSIVDPDLIMDEPIYTFGNNRGYIWEETMELIKEKPVFGYGMGTLTYYFPHGSKDYYAHRVNANELISKPHNFYLGVAYGCGIPALLALLALFVLFVLKERPLLKPIADTNIFQAQTAKTASWLCCISLMIQFLVNDMMLATSIVFWIMFGLCYSIPSPEILNKLLKGEK